MPCPESTLAKVVHVLITALERENKALTDALASASKANALNEIQRAEFSSRVTILESQLNSIALNNDRKIEQKRRQWAAELAQLQNDFACLLKATQTGKREPQEVTISERLIATSYMLKERNEIIPSMEDALETLSTDKTRLRRERDFLKRTVQILEGKISPKNDALQAWSEKLQDLMADSLNTDGVAIKTTKDFRDWVEALQEKAEKQEVIPLLSDVRKLQSSDFKVHINYFGSKSVNFSPGLVAQGSASFAEETPDHPESDLDDISEDTAANSANETKSIDIGVGKAVEGETLESMPSESSDLKANQVEEEEARRMALDEFPDNRKRCHEQEHNSRFAEDRKELYRVVSKKDFPSSTAESSHLAEVEALQRALGDLGREQASKQPRAAKQTVDWMMNEMSDLKVQNEGHEIQIGILERNRNMLEENVRQLETELEGYRKREKAVVSEKR